MKAGLLAALVSAAALEVPTSQARPDKMTPDELYAAYLVQGPAILKDAFPSGTRWPEFRTSFRERALPAWERQPRRPSRAMFMLDIAMTTQPRIYWPEFLHGGQAYLRQRPERPGADPGGDAFEIQWNKTAVAFLDSLHQPDVLETFVRSLADRILPAARGDGQPALVDPWVDMARGFAEEYQILHSPQSCTGPDCMIERRGRACLDAYAAAARHEVNRAEAIVRSARVLLFWQRPADALAMLDTFDEQRTADRAIVYWARLLRARSLDDLGRSDDAAAAYGRALEIAASAQSPRMGQLMIQARRGDRDAAALVADGVRAAADPVLDPWWEYATGDFRLFKDRLTVLRSLVTK